MKLKATNQSTHLLTDDKETVLVYHDTCLDGTASAWAVKKAFTLVGMENQITYFPDQYNEYRINPNDVLGKNLLIVDFSYPKEIMTKLIEVAHSVTVIDHHDGQTKGEIEALLKSGEIYGEHDTSRAGCHITWDFFFESEPPALLAHVADGDLYKFALENTRDVLSAVYAGGFSIDNFEKMLDSDVETLSVTGAAINDARMREITEHVSQSMFWMDIKGHVVPVVFAPNGWRNQTCELMYEALNIPFAVNIDRRGNGLKLSFRSKKGVGINVVDVAESFNGSGHKHAAGGFVSELDTLGTIIPCQGKI